MHPGARMELKYRLDTAAYLCVRASLAPHMRRDAFTRGPGRKGYVVRSLYFDTLDYRLYGEKVDGNHERAKCRLRVHSEGPALSPDAPVRVEIKRREGGRTVKEVALVTPAQYAAFLRGRDWQAENPVLAEFARMVRTGPLSPKVLVRYLREGYESRMPGDLRITFDHRVESAQADALEQTPLFYRQHDPHQIVMEIKFARDEPAWLRDLVMRHGLTLQANSKYAQAVQVAMRELHHPDGVVILR